MMSNKKKLSFWDEPPWFEKFWAFRTKIGMYVALPLLILQGIYYGNWTDLYALAVPLLIFGLGYIIKKIGDERLREQNYKHPGNHQHTRGVSCLALLAIFVVLESAGFVVLGVDWKSRISRDLFIITVIAAIILAALGILAAANAIKPKKCKKCGASKPRFELECSEGKSALEGHYCREHFREAVHSQLAKYKGQFLLIDRPSDCQLVTPQLSFYTLKDLPNGCYSDQDIESARQLFERVIPSKEQDTFAVLVPAEPVAHLDPCDEEPLLRCKPEDARCLPMTYAEFNNWLDQLITRVDQTNCEFCMNLPYAETGLYILEDLY